MKNILRKIIAPLLATFAYYIVRKYKPTVIMITGSVGKTSTKDAIAAALSESTYLRASEKSYNSEFGVPLTIVGAKNPWLSPIGWLRVFKEAIALLIFPNHYPKTLILEVGADRPGDLIKILEVATPDVVVVTRLPAVPVHVEAYATPEAVREEEFVPAYGLAPQAPLIVCAEDEYALAYAKRLPVSVSTFGFTEGANIHIQEPKLFTEKKRAAGTETVLTIDGKEKKLVVRGVIGRQQLLAAAAAIAVAHALSISTTEALKGLASYTPPPGRMRILEGKNDTMLIDDSYNSSPVAAQEALNAVAQVPGVRRRIAVLGDMLELGRYSVAEHEKIGTLAAEHMDIIIAVGLRARVICEGARKAGFTQADLHCFASTEEASAFLLSHIKPGDVILLKGSQSIRVERIVEALLADPADAARLVRQDKEWKKR